MAAAVNPSINGQKVDIRESIKTVVSKMGAGTPKDAKIEHGKLLVKIFEKKMTPKQAMNVSDEELSIFYKYAFHLFKSGKYAEAGELYKMLFVLDPEETAFGTSLAACYHKMKDYESALMVYLMQSQISPEDPTPLFYAYDCFIRMDNPLGAYLMLRGTIKRAGDRPEYTPLRRKAEALFERFDPESIAGINVEEL